MFTSDMALWCAYWVLLKHIKELVFFYLFHCAHYGGHIRILLLSCSNREGICL